MPYDPKDPKATEAFWKDAVEHTGLAELRRKRGQRGRQKAPTKQQVSIRLSRDVLTHFKRKGPGWQTRIDEALRAAINRK